MKNKIKKWLGITSLEEIVGGPEKKREKGDFWSRSFASVFDSIIFSSYYTPNTLYQRYETLKKDFDELDKKFDELEKYLQIEYFKKDEQTQTYDWADKKHTEGFRKTKPYKQIKAAKEKPATSDYLEEDDL